MTAYPPVAISAFTAREIETRAGELGELLTACVLDGASIGFILPFAAAEGEAFWLGRVLPSVRNGGATLLVAEAGGRIAGTVLLDHDTMPNQPHRAEARKLLVHPDFRRRGVARALMAALEDLAARLGRSLITLDTRTGDSAESLYVSLGYQVTGIIPGYCRDAREDRLDATTIMYKAL